MAHSKADKTGEQQEAAQCGEAMRAKRSERFVIKPKDPKDKKPVPVGLYPVISETAKAVEVQANEQGDMSDEDWEIAEQICRLVEVTPKGLDTICSTNEGLVSSRTFHRWLEANLGLRQRYARAKERQADMLAFQTVEIADTPQEGVKQKIGGVNGDVTEKGDMIEHRRLQVDARKWLAGKLAPKKYGDKVEVEHSGEQKHTIKFTRG